MKLRAVISSLTALVVMSVIFVPQISFAQNTRGSDAEAQNSDTQVTDAETTGTTPKPEKQTSKTQKQLRAEALKARNDAELRVEADMQRMTNIAEALSKNLGQIHYLRTLCFGSDDQKWRIYANDMMQVEAPDDAELRSQFVRAFNAGYYQEQDRHNQCSNNVSVDVAALAENSRNLAAMLGDPFRQR